LKSTLQAEEKWIFQERDSSGKIQSAEVEEREDHYTATNQVIEKEL
jgi:hypothetical protein